MTVGKKRQAPPVSLSGTSAKGMAKVTAALFGSAFRTAVVMIGNVCRRVARQQAKKPSTFMTKCGTVS